MFHAAKNSSLAKCPFLSNEGQLKLCKERLPLLTAHLAGAGYTFGLKYWYPFQLNKDSTGAWPAVICTHVSLQKRADLKS